MTYDFKYICSTNGGSSGSPILDLETNKVIGIHCIALKKEIEQTTINGKTTTKVKENDFNGGIFLKDPILEFQNNCNCHIINNPRNNDGLHINRYDKGCNTDNHSGLYGLSELIIIHNFLNKLKSIKKSVPNSNQNSNKNSTNNLNQNSKKNSTNNLNQNSNKNSNQNPSKGNKKKERYSMYLHLISNIIIPLKK